MNLLALKMLRLRPVEYAHVGCGSNTEPQCLYYSGWLCLAPVSMLTVVAVAKLTLSTVTMLILAAVTANIK